MGPNTVGAVARLVGMDSSSVPRAIAPMQKCSWVSVTQGKDRRQRIIDITAAGRSQLMLALPIWEEIQRAMLGHIGFDNWQSMMSSLKTIRDAAVAVGKDD
jgi:DNA-binding MarR family transcriptional regulator